MCRGKKSCVLLGNDANRWTRFEPLAPDTSLLAGFPHFDEAVHHAAGGDVEAAKSALHAVDSSAIREWFVEHAQVAGAARFHALNRPPIPKYTGAIDPVPYPSQAIVSQVLAADGHRCRYCQRPVVNVKVLKLVEEIVGKDSFSLGPTNAEMHGSAFAHRGAVDHVMPRTRGGPTEPRNLVTACYPCNYGKAHYTLEELALDLPRPPLLDGWDGLQSLVPELKKRARLATAARVERHAKLT
jgi:hypothetical protein